ncbi:hypothetical protein [Pedobacter ureilyticus]|uniref:Uncharacterized protein n=1 Tax=Pedobacter ureilyticus TaxID=1393051 RepID=A0ABW9J240_9SPHI|nr:hypothetical protein [Pedobacter helvus]
MKFDKILNILHEGIIENVNSLVTSSISLENSFCGEEMLIHTGVVVTRDQHFNIEILYCSKEEKLYHQILSRNTGYFLRSVGLHMHRNKHDFYSPFNPRYIDQKRTKVRYYNVFFEDRFAKLIEINCDFSELIMNFNSSEGCKDLDVVLDFGSFNAANYLQIEKILNNKFLITFELGNEIIVLNEFPLAKYYKYYAWHKDDVLRDFFLPAKKQINARIPTPSWNKLADEELKNLDDDFPGWSSGVWD